MPVAISPASQAPACLGVPQGCYFCLGPPSLIFSCLDSLSYFGLSSHVISPEVTTSRDHTQGHLPSFLCPFCCPGHSLFHLCLISLTALASLCLDVHICENACCCLPPWDKHSTEEGLCLAYSLLDPSDFIHGWHPENVDGIHGEFGDKSLCLLSVAAVTNYQTLDGFTQNKCICSQFWGPEV